MGLDLGANCLASRGDAMCSLESRHDGPHCWEDIPDPGPSVGADDTRWEDPRDTMWGQP